MLGTLAGSSEDQQLAGPRFTLRRAPRGRARGVHTAACLSACPALTSRCSLLLCAPLPSITTRPPCSDEHDHPESPPLGRSRYLRKEDEDDAAPAAADSRHASQRLENISLDSP